jgi:leukocyte immunoglobulin-like receptor
VVTSVEILTLQCVSLLAFARFILTKEGESKVPGPRTLRAISVGIYRPCSLWTLSRWMFRCFGYYRNQPQVWSAPSDLLELLVSGEVA